MCREEERQVVMDPLSHVRSASHRPPAVSHATVLWEASPTVEHAVKEEDDRAADTPRRDEGSQEEVYD
eukprot:273837-Hanusia_phi.AAC.1